MDVGTAEMVVRLPDVVAVSSAVVVAAGDVV